MAAITMARTSMAYTISSPKFDTSEVFFGVQLA